MFALKRLSLLYRLEIDFKVTQILLLLTASKLIDCNYINFNIF